MEVAILGSPLINSIMIVLIVLLIVPVPSSLSCLCGRKATLNLTRRTSEFRSCVKVEVNVLGSTSLTVLMVSVDVKQH